MPAQRWWQNGVIYQLLVPSFQDSNGDGVGDLPGILQRIDHLDWLGVTAIWLSPICASPMVELGYDISNFTEMNPVLGTMDDFDRVVAEAHSRGIKVILDWVPNHTSDQHAWFRESRSSRDNPKRDWYIWRDARPDGSAPNNWLSIFGGSVWEWDPHTEQYYLHTFLDQQPDLNWRNNDMQQAMFDAMRFWLDRGVDGFRLDALCLLMKHAEFPDNPVNPDYNPQTHGPDEAVLSTYTRDQPESHEVIATMRRIIDEYDDRVLLGELYLPLEKVVGFYGSQERPELHLPLNMRFAWAQWSVGDIASIVRQLHALLPEGAWPSWTISTHDNLRVAWRVSGEQTRCVAMLLNTLKGTPTLYYGEEVGMTGVDIPADRAVDPQGQRIGRNRDPERTPMQWDGSPRAGFTTGNPWLPIGDDVATANVDAQRDNPHSLLCLYRRLIAMRREVREILEGTFEVLSEDSPVLSYISRGAERQVLTVLNFGADDVTYHLPDDRRGRILLSTFLDREGDEVMREVHIRGDEGVVLMF